MDISLRACTYFELQSLLSKASKKQKLSPLSIIIWLKLECIKKLEEYVNIMKTLQRHLFPSYDSSHPRIKT